MTIIPTESSRSDHLLVVKLSDLIPRPVLAKVSVTHDLGRGEIMRMIVGVTDGLCNKALDYNALQEYLKLLTGLNKELGVHRLVIETAKKLSTLIPPYTQELIYLRTTGGKLFIHIGVTRAASSPIVTYF